MKLNVIFVRKFALEEIFFQNNIKLHQYFECANCGKSIKMNSKTSRMKKCEGDKLDFNCKFCPYVNNRRDRLRKHTARKHERKEDVFSSNFYEFNTTITLGVRGWKLGLLKYVKIFHQTFTF